MAKTKKVGDITYNFYKRYSSRKTALKSASQMRKSTGLPSRVFTFDKNNYDVYVGYHN